MALRSTRRSNRKITKSLSRLAAAAILLPPNLLYIPVPAFGAGLVFPAEWAPEVKLVFVPAVVAIVDFFHEMVVAPERNLLFLPAIAFSALPILYVWTLGVALVLMISTIKLHAEQ